MTTDDLIALEKAATPGEWRVEADASRCNPDDLTDLPEIGIVGPEHFGFGGDDMNDVVSPDRGISTYANAELICATRNLAPELFALAKAAEAFVASNMEQYDDQGQAFRLKKARDTYRAKLAQMRDGA